MTYHRERAWLEIENLAKEVLKRNLLDPLWPCLTESEWSADAKRLAAGFLAAKADCLAAEAKLSDESWRTKRSRGRRGRQGTN